MKKKDIISKIKKQAYENVNKKLEKETKEVERKINEELDVVEKILKYIKNKLIFKKIGDSWDYSYVLVTEEIFFQDYTRKPEYNWDEGIEIKYNRKNNYEPFIKVNGENYYDIRYIIRNYQDTFDSYKNKLQRLNESFREIENEVEELKRKEPAIKKLIEEYQLLDLEENE